ncbi:MAG: hypothetical protein KBD53_05600 [Candidatus Omnitrophica bacterium]|nr:hypothetical protein [Candidatus Omnitrophota bacterium]
MNTFRTSSADELDQSVQSAQQNYEGYQDWRIYEEEKIEYLVGKTKTEIVSQYGNPQGKRFNRKYYYKGESSIAEEEWIFNESDSESKYKISFFFKADQVAALAIY